MSSNDYQIGLDIANLKARVERMESQRDASLTAPPLSKPSKAVGPSAEENIDELERWQRRALTTHSFLPTDILRATLHETIYGTTAISCLDILNSALRLLFIHNGVNGLCANGDLLTAGRLVEDWNGGARSGYDEREFQAFLTGNFGTYYYPIIIQHPDPSFDAGSWGSAYVRIGSQFVLNHWDILRDANAAGWPLDNSGADRLVWVFASVIMHELSHCQAKDHPDTVNWTAGSVYATSLPYVVQRAVLMRSPYWSVFQSSFALTATDNSRRDCRIRR